MMAQKLMDWIDEIGRAEDMFGELEIELNEAKYNVLVKIEHDPDNRRLNAEYRDICEKLRMVYIMRQQRLMLFMQAQV